MLDDTKNDLIFLLKEHDTCAEEVWPDSCLLLHVCGFEL